MIEVQNTNTKFESIYKKIFAKYGVVLLDKIKEPIHCTTHETLHFDLHFLKVACEQWLVPDMSPVKSFKDPI